VADQSVTLLEELRKEKESDCPFQIMLEAMEPELREQVLQALADRTFSTASIVRALNKRNFDIGRHRLQECRDRCKCGALKGTE